MVECKLCFEVGAAWRAVSKQRGEVLLVGLQRLVFAWGLPAVVALFIAFALSPPARADVSSNEVYLIDGVSVSLDQLVEEFLAVSLGHDGRVLKWSTDRERLLGIGTRPRANSRSVALDPGIRDFIPVPLSQIQQETGLEWNPSYPPSQEETDSGISLRIRIVNPNWWVSPPTLTADGPPYHCVNTHCRRGSLKFPSVQDKYEVGEGLQNLEEFQGLEFFWKEIANGRVWTEPYDANQWNGHAWAWLRITASREIGHALCAITHLRMPQWARADFLECLTRSLGFPGSSQLFPQAVLGVRLPERPDIFYGEDGIATAEEYVDTLPTSYTEFDRLMLRALYDPRVRAGDSQEQLRAILPDVLSDAVEAILR